MTTNNNKHRLLRLAFAFAVGLALAIYAYLAVNDPEPRRQRALEESVVTESRHYLAGYVAPDTPLDIVDAMAPDRKVGKVYIYPHNGGWQVSGYYRRHDKDSWHPFLMTLDEQVRLLSLNVRDNDKRLAGVAATDDKLTVTQ